MTDDATTVAAPSEPSSRAVYTEQLHVLVDTDTRAYILGKAQEVALQRGYKFLRQADVIRDLLYAALALAYQDNTDAYAATVRAGRKIAAEPATGAAPRPVTA